MGDDMVNARCVTWAGAQATPKFNGCVGFHYGRVSENSAECQGCSANVRSYPACDLTQCTRMCEDLFKGNDHEIMGCKEGCGKYLDLGGCRRQDGTCFFQGYYATNGTDPPSHQTMNTADGVGCQRRCQAEDKCSIWTWEVYLERQAKSQPYPYAQAQA